MNVRELHNTYYVMRHGQSQANLQQVIVSDPEQGVSRYGLTEEGRNQVTRFAQNALDAGILDDHTVIVSSDFSRALESAEIVAQVLHSAEVQASPRLRERSFGKYEGMPDSNYEAVWGNDTRQEPQSDAMGVESTDNVLTRVLGLIEELEETYTNRTIVLVSHGDTLQILLTAFSDVSSSGHRSLTPLATAEIRRCN